MISNISKIIEYSIDEFWEDITILNRDKLIIDGENICMLYFYVILQAKIPYLYTYIKMIDEFSTPYIRSISKYGYLISTFEIALERI